MKNPHTHSTNTIIEQMLNQESYVKLIKITIDKYSYDLDKNWINADLITNNIIGMLGNQITLNELYYFMADYCASNISYHPDFNKLATRICIERLHNCTNANYEQVIKNLYENIDKEDKHTPLISEELKNTVTNNAKQIQEQIDYSRDNELDYFGIRTLERSYLYRIHDKDTLTFYKDEKSGRMIERPQHMFMRVALGIHGNDLVRAFETYHLMSQRYFTHATPTLFNAGSSRSQLSSCFLLDMPDSIEGITHTLSNVMKISKWAGGIGIHLNDIRSSGSIIRGTNGISDGVVPLCGVLNKIGKYINQGGKRNGSICCYIEPWHADIFDFCELKKNTKDEDTKTRDLFLALWVPDLFMKRVESDQMWSLMCPDECPNLTDTYGDEFEKLYESYERECRFKRQVRAQELWFHILDAQTETGMPFILYKDSVNKKSNQKNIGVIKSSNLCCEIIQVSNEKEVAVCNLASLCLPKFIVTNKESGEKIFDFKKLIEVSRIATYNLNKIIDINYYPVPEAEYSNKKNRPVGVGIQGLADVFNILGMPFGSYEANKLNKQIFETIYYGCLLESNELAKQYGPYETFEGSPFSEGILQFHEWNVKPDMYDWNSLIENIKKYGTRNSLLTALMPTASTSQIMGNYESFEPYMSNIFTRTTLAGKFIVINNNLVNDLIKENLWSVEMRNKIIVLNGSVQQISEIPQHLKDIYKTAFEIKQKDIIDQAVGRGCFIDQTQSMNIFLNDSGYKRLSSSLFHGWKNGLKTGMYYLRSLPAVTPTKFGIDITIMNKILKESSCDQELISDEIKKTEGEEERDTDFNEILKKSTKSTITYRKKKNQSNDDILDKKRKISRSFTDCEMCSG
jgi:ribonucleoside-diphosphate reductase alpha chain